MYSLAQAAKAAGKSKPTIARVIKAGRIAAARSEDGSYSIDPVELARVFPLAGDSIGTMKHLVPPTERVHAQRYHRAKSKDYVRCWSSARQRFAVCAPD